jgi:acetoacetyl-CoA synthetase
MDSTTILTSSTCLSRSEYKTMKLWEPSEHTKKAARVTAFIDLINSSESTTISDFHGLYDFSITNPASFWRHVWKFCEIKASSNADMVIENPERMPGARWFPGSRLNFAENLLRYKDENLAIIFRGEDAKRSTLTYAELNLRVAQMANALRSAGVSKGDRVAAMVPNMPETIIAMLGAASIGAVWSSCSPDFGVQGVLDRFGQIEPKVFITADGYFFKGKAIDCLEKAASVIKELKTVSKVVVIPYVNERPDLNGLNGSENFNDFLDPEEAGPSAVAGFEQLPFDHPLYVMFSSGTTGKPKCIVHSAGGTLLEHLKELVLHCDLRRSDRIFYQTTCGWMMWNWLVSSLACGATVVLYDGAPFHREGRILFDIADEERITIFGTNAKYISALEKEGIRPAKSHSLNELRSILSTGSPLAMESFDFIYNEVKSDVCLSSISGGTDILGCFALGSPLLPVHRGELQCRSLGMKVEVFDDEGRSLVGEKGQLVCTAPFPSMPIGFWNDSSGEKYHQAYFDVFPNVWHHGDYVELNERGGMVFYGRSDAVLNPGGIRIGTAEIYNQVEQLSEISESIVISQRWQNDERIVLFVKLKSGHTLDENLKEKIRKQIRTNTTAFHVPRKILEVEDIPRTRSGKIVELAVKNIVHGLPIKNMSALANPEALDFFKDRAELSSD